MEETKDPHHHLVEIPATGDHQKPTTTVISAIQHHPSTEISESPGHLLLLKLLHREEHLSGRRVAGKETRRDTLRREIFQLCLFFFTFHGLFLTIISTSANQSDVGACRKWWVPMMTSVSFCLVMVVLVQMKLFRYWSVCEEIVRERSDYRGLTRCIWELRSKGVGFDLSKGVGFDLSKGPGIGKRVKSSSVEIKWKPLTWCSKYFVTMCLVLASGLVIPLCKFMICA